MDPWLILALFLNMLQTAAWLLYLRWLQHERLELTKLLASRNITEYSLAEARMAKAISPEQKPDGGYGNVWEEGHNGEEASD